MADVVLADDYEGLDEFGKGAKKEPKGRLLKLAPKDGEPVLDLPYVEDSTAEVA